jgi:hypothetical protein
MMYSKRDSYITTAIQPNNLARALDDDEKPVEASSPLDSKQMDAETW